MRSSTGLVLLAFACGVAWLQACAALPPAPWAIALLSMLVLAGAGRALCRRRGRRGVALLLVGASALCTGFGYAAWRADLRLGDELPREWEGRDLRVVGVIDDLPAVSARGARFAFSVDRVDTPLAVVPSRISLLWPEQLNAGDGNDDGDDDGVPELRAGERWSLVVRLTRPHGNVNPGGFDLEAWLLQQGLRATGTVRPVSSNARIDAFAGRVGDHVQRARETLRERIRRALGDLPYAGVVTALAIGDQRAIPQSQWAVFNRTGVTHLVSISGLHVTVFASFAGGLAYALARRSARFTTRCPARKLAAVVGALAAGAYVLLAGAEIPALRTFAMLLVAACGLWCGRPGTAGIVWLWALVAVLLVDPWAPLTPGFWLSYGAVALLLYAGCERVDERPSRSPPARIRTVLADGAFAQWVVTVGLTPLTLALFGQVSLISPVANAVAIPVVTLGIVPLALAGIVLPFDALFQLAHDVLVPLMRLLEALSGWSDAVWQQHAPRPWTIVAGLAGTLWLLAPRGVPGRALGVVGLASLLVVRPALLPDGAFRMTVLDVGQGLAVVIETRHSTLVYDTGPRYTETADAGGRIVAPFLRAAGLSRTDGLIVSHQDLDHVGGALSLLQTVPLGWLASSLPADHPVAVHAGAHADVIACIAGQRWTWDGVHFSVLHPTPAEYADPYEKTNNRSCVVRIDSAHGSVLLTGDIEAKVEKSLLRTRQAQLAADVLVVPHHGSRTSSTWPFLRAVAPTMAIFGCGYRNRFGHPRPDILARYSTIGASIRRTDQEGALSLTFAAGQGLVAVGARRERGRYWLDSPAADVVASVD